MNTDIESIAKFVVTELVNQDIIGHSVGTNWVLNKPLFGYEGDLSMGSKQDAINQLAPRFVTTYQKSTGLKVAS